MGVTERAGTLPRVLERADELLGLNASGEPTGVDGLGIHAPAAGTIRHALSNIHPADRPAVADAWARVVDRPGAHVAVELWFRSGDDWERRRHDLVNRLDDPAIGAVLVGVTTISVDEHPQEDRGGDQSEPDDARWSVLRVSPVGEILDAEGTVEVLYGRTRAELVGSAALELIHPDDRETLLRCWTDVCEGSLQGRALRQRVVRPDGHATWVLASIGRPDADGLVTVHDLDITDVLAAEAALRASENRFRELAEGLPTGVFVADLDGTLDFTNRRCDTLTWGVASWTDLLPDAEPSWSALVATATEEGEAAHDYLMSDGTVLRIRCLRPLPDGSVHGVVEDVTTPTKWRQAAAIDPLTGLANRLTTTTEIRRRIDARIPTTVAFVDLDGFKRVNDANGHDAGDRVLRDAGTALADLVRDDDVAGRWGGDEFVLVLDAVPHDAVDDLRRRIVEALLACGTAGASVGFSDLRVGDDVSIVIGRADVAMYADKQRDR